MGRRLLRRFVGLLCPAFVEVGIARMGGGGYLLVFCCSTGGSGELGLIIDSSAPLAVTRGSQGLVMV